MRNTNKRQGFTIVELVIVIAVIAILAGVLIPTFSNVIQKAKDSRDQQDALNIYKEQVLALKADNELEDINNNGKEEVLVVLRKDQDDEKYFYFNNGAQEEYTDQEYDIAVDKTGKIAITRLVKVTSANIDQIVGKKVVIAAKYEGEWYLMGSVDEKGPRISAGNGSLPIFNDGAQQLKVIKNGEYYRFEKSEEEYLRSYSSTNIELTNTNMKADKENYNWTISFTNTNQIKLMSVATPSKEILMSNGNDCFKNYASSNTGNSGYATIEMYLVIE